MVRVSNGRSSGLGEGCLERSRCSYASLAGKASCKRLGLRNVAEGHRYDSRVFGLIVSVPGGLAPIPLKRIADRDDRGGEPLSGKPNFNGAQPPVEFRDKHRCP